MLARVVRSGVVEAVHEGAVAAVDVDGRLVAHSGDIESRYFTRSTIKPFQATVAQRMGAALVPEHLAVAASSHGGQPVHLSIIESMLGEVGLGPEYLRCPPAWPLGASAHARVLRAGHHRRQPIWHNCSGKHAAMLRACVAQGWPVETYLDPKHPLQLENQGLLATVTGGDPMPVGVDGCGAPTYRISTRELATAFARLAADDQFAEVRTAMHRYPGLTSDVDGHDARIATCIDAVAKRGAEGVLGVAVRNQLGIALKAWDGARRGVGVGMVAVLGQLNLMTDAAREQLADMARPPVFGGGVEVGSVEPAVQIS